MNSVELCHSRGFLGSSFFTNRTAENPAFAACPDTEQVIRPDDQERASVPAQSFSVTSIGSSQLIHFCEDEALGRSRGSILEKVGFRTYTYRSSQIDRLEEVPAGFLAAVLLCQTVSSQTALGLSRCFKGRAYQAPVVRLSREPHQEKDPNAYDVLLPAPVDPVDLVRAMTPFLGSRDLQLLIGLR